MESLLQDLRYAARALRGSPGFTLAAVLTLALGVGANTTIFSAANAVLLRPVDAADPERIVRIYRGHHSPLGYDEFAFVREHARSFSGVFAQEQARLALNEEAGNEPVAAELVSGNYFSLLGVGAAAGRVFTAAEDAPGAASVVVLSHGFWQRRFGGDPALIGRTIRLNGQEITVAGVAREGFTGAFLGFAPDLWAPLAAVEPLLGVELESWGSSVYVYGRLRPGVSRQQAQAEARTLAAELTRRDPTLQRPIELRIDHARGLNAEVRGTAWGVAAGLLAVVGLVLLIACANLANLLLARAARRRREIGVRLALGAGRGRLVRQLLTESLLLALLGGTVALLLTFWTTTLLRRFVPQEAALSLDLSPDHRVLLFALGISLLAGLLFGLAPALRATSAELVPALREESTGYRRSRLRSGFVVFQVMLSMLLLAGAGLFLRSLANAHTIDPGFEAEGVLDLPLDLGLAQYTPEAGREFYRRVVETAEALPGVRSATLAEVVPLGGTNMEAGFLLEGDSEEGGRRMTYFNTVAPQYFATLGIPVVRGREFSWMEDAPEAPGVAVVNEAFVRRFLPEGEALGRRIRFEGPDGPFITVVGVVRDAKYVTLGEEPKPTLYRAFPQRYTGEMTLQVRSTGDPDALREPLREAIAALDPRLPVPMARPMTADMEISLLPARFAATLLSLFGGVALLLALLGIYGVLAHAVAERTREMGIRTALGAAPGAVLRLVLGQSMRWVAVGVVLGLGLALLLGRAAAGLLYGVSPADPLVLLGSPLLLVAMALLASYLPARRAMRVDPMVALRAE